jgi:hypothetical protein
MKATIDIDKVKFKNDLFIEVHYKEDFEDKHRNLVHKECNAPVHEDLKKCFERLGVHLPILCEYLDETQLPEDIDSLSSPILESFKVTQISVGADGDGVTITGSRKLKTGKVLNLNAPHTKYYEEDGYRYAPDLQIAVANLVAEVELYMEGKHGEGAQLEMSFNGNEEEGI